MVFRDGNYSRSRQRTREENLNSLGSRLIFLLIEEEKGEIKRKENEIQDFL
jgi:hypothetical protein